MSDADKAAVWVAPLLINPTTARQQMRRFRAAEAEKQARETIVEMFVVDPHEQVSDDPADQFGAFQVHPTFFAHGAAASN